MWTESEINLLANWCFVSFFSFLDSFGECITSYCTHTAHHTAAHSSRNRIQCLCDLHGLIRSTCTTACVDFIKQTTHHPTTDMPNDRLKLICQNRYTHISLWIYCFSTCADHLRGNVQDIVAVAGNFFFNWHDGLEIEIGANAACRAYEFNRFSFESLNS